MLVEIVGGLAANSLAIITDAATGPKFVAPLLKFGPKFEAHMLSDVGGFIVSLLAIQLSQMEATQEYTYGYKQERDWVRFARQICCFARQKSLARCSLSLLYGHWLQSCFGRPGHVFFCFFFFFFVFFFVMVQSLDPNKTAVFRVANSFKTPVTVILLLVVMPGRAPVHWVSWFFNLQMNNWAEPHNSPQKKTEAQTDRWPIDVWLPNRVLNFWKQLHYITQI